MKKAETKRRSGSKIMLGLLGMIRPLLGVMCIAILMGCVGNLMATFLTVLGGYGFLNVMGIYEGMALPWIFGCMIAFAILRGVLRYAEQASNHYLAFKLLARIRHQVFAVLCRLAPAKLDGSEKGNLISIITSDIELLEVFYAHTISPIAIAVLTSAFMVVFLATLHPLCGVVGLFFYMIVGVVIPLVNGRSGSENGLAYRDAFGRLNACVLDNLYGLEEIMEYRQQENRREILRKETNCLERTNRKLKKGENRQRVTTDGVILFAGVAMALVAAQLWKVGAMDAWKAVIAVIAMMSSFGPTAALSALSNNLHHTLAAGNRILDILEEKPQVEDITAQSGDCSGDIVCEGISFTYQDQENRQILQNFHAVFAENRVHGIQGKSGCGKSTLLKLLMRFYEADRGKIAYGTDEITQINTCELRSNISYMTQETFLFGDTIENNIKVAKADATREEVIAAAKKASIHDFIMSTPNGYDTRLAELGASVSGGEKQRIGLARAFLHESDILFLDEPTSNIDSLNEGIILKSLEQEKQNKTILFVSHRRSTMGIADEVKAM